MAEADCIVLVVDGQSGVTGADEEIVTWLRRTHPQKPVAPSAGLWRADLYPSTHHGAKRHPACLVPVVIVVIEPCQLLILLLADLMMHGHDLETHVAQAVSCCR